MMVSPLMVMPDLTASSRAKVTERPELLVPSPRYVDHPALDVCEAAFGEQLHREIDPGADRCRPAKGARRGEDVGR